MKRRAPHVPTSQRVYGCVVLLVALLFGALAIIVAKTKLPLIVRGVRTTGVVIAVDETLRGSRRSGVVEFRDRAGFAHRFESTSTYKRVGDVVDVLYLPSQPDRGAEGSFSTTWLPVILLPLLSAFLFTAGRAIYGIGDDSRRPRRR